MMIDDSAGQQTQSLQRCLHVDRGQAFVEGGRDVIGNLIDGRSSINDVHVNVGQPCEELSEERPDSALHLHGLVSLLAIAPSFCRIVGRDVEKVDKIWPRQTDLWIPSPSK